MLHTMVGLAQTTENWNASVSAFQLTLIPTDVGIFYT
jgi:hypothetical protein